MTIGQTIREARLKKGMTQEELAEKTDISIRTIQRIENGEVDPRSYTLQSIAKVLEINYEELANFKIDRNDREENLKEDPVLLSMLHLSGLLLLLFPPILIWLSNKDKVRNIRQHAIDVINFQLSMLIFLIPGGILAMILIGIPIVIFFGFYSFIIILVNTVKVLNGQPYKYPLSFHILKP
jgi:transcriptional regulator with XRE-family HTH domain